MQIRTLRKLTVTSSCRLMIAYDLCKQKHLKLSESGQSYQERSKRRAYRSCPQHAPAGGSGGHAEAEVGGDRLEGALVISSIALSANNFFG
jgi:hypothetical protein